MRNTPFSHRDVYRTERRGTTSSRGILGVKKLGSQIGTLFQRILKNIFRKRCLIFRRFQSCSDNMNVTQKLLRAAFVFIGLIMLWGFIYLLVIFFTLPDVDEVGALFAAQSTIITDRNGTELYRIHGDEDRTLVHLSDISDYVEQATIAIEDQRFYERDCIDIRALARVVLHFGRAGGGSTITRQHARNALGLKKESLVSRKLKEIVLGCQLESRYSKDEVLELYLNRIPYGNNAYGVEQASKTYFAKSASGLTLAEAAVLASLPQLPSYLSPYRNHVRTTLSKSGEERFAQGKIHSIKNVRDEDFWLGLVGETFGSGSTALYIGGRTDQVLKNMYDQGFITDEERTVALVELQNITFQRARENIRAPHFVLWVREQIKEQFSDQFDEGFLESGGLKITTALDWDLQQIAEGVIQEIGQTNIDLYGAYNAALIAADPKTGHILAYVGNRDYWDESTDGNVDIVQAPRQPGSSFKPFSYAAAFLNGYGPSTVLYDVPTKIGDDVPENFDGRFLGPLTIRDALASSRNIPAAKSFFLAGGEEAVVELAASMGVPTVRDRKAEITSARGVSYEYGWPLALGAAEVPLYEMVQGYTTFARGGTMSNLVSILRVEDHLGNILYEVPEEPEEQDVLDPRVSGMITSILSDSLARPAGYWRDQLTIPGYQTAAKTGTSNKCITRNEKTNVCTESKPDNTWTIGYTPNLVAGAWAGNASGGALYVRAAGLDTASPIWRRFMMAAHKTLKGTKTEFSLPDGLSSVQISKLSGKLASSCTPVEFRSAELFFADAPIREFDDACLQIEVDKLTGLLASEECPAEAREAGSFFRPQSVLPNRWPLWEQGVQSWAHDLSLSPLHSRQKLPDLVKPIDMEDRGSIFWKTIGMDESGKPIKVFRGTGAFLPLPLPLAPSESCTLDLTPGRLVKPTLHIAYPSHGGTATSPSFQPKIRYTVGHTVREVRYELDGRTVAVTGSGTSLEPRIRLSRRFDSTGLHTLRVTLTDSYFNQVTDSVRFTFKRDEGIPQVRILSPPDGAVLTAGQELTIMAEASDAGGAVDRVQFYLGDQLLTTRRSVPYQVTFVLDADAVGETEIRVVALDAAKNRGEDVINIHVVKP